MKKKLKKQTEKSTGMAALADGNMGMETMRSAMFDPSGTWTGTPFTGEFYTEDLMPEQDVDDL